MEWTTEPPTKPGWYWHCDPERDGETQVFEVWLESGTLWLSDYGEFVAVSRMYGRWMGPLDVPDPPEK